MCRSQLGRHPINIESIIAVVSLFYTIQVLISSITTVSCSVVTSDSQCSGKDIELYDLQNRSIYICWPWQDCPHGQELSVKPGSIHPKGTTIECVGCPGGMYSNDKTNGSCLPCTSCAYNRELRPCTTTQDRECDKHGCISDAYYLNATDQKCSPCAECCSARDNNIEPQCISMAVGTVIAANGAKHCKQHNSSTLYSNLHCKPTSFNNSSINESSPNQYSLKCDSSLDKLHVVLIVLLVISLLSVAVLVWKLWKMKQRLSRAESASSFSPSLSSGGEVNTVRYFPGNSCTPCIATIRNGDKLIFIPEDTRLSDLPPDIEEKVMKLDAKCPRTVKNWFHVGRKFDISMDDLNMIKREDDRPGGSPTKELIGKLLTLENVPTLRKFVAVLQEIGRHDIANPICEWYKNSNLNVTDGIVLTV